MAPATQPVKPFIEMLQFKNIWRDTIQQMICDECSPNFTEVPERVYLSSENDLKAVYEYFKSVLVNFKDPDKFLWNILR